MSEYASGYNNPPEQEQPALPDLELEEILTNMPPEERQTNKVRLLAEISDRESIVHAINRIQEANDEIIDIAY